MAEIGGTPDPLHPLLVFEGRPRLSLGNELVDDLCVAFAAGIAGDVDMNSATRRNAKVRPGPHHKRPSHRAIVSGFVGIERGEGAPLQLGIDCLVTDVRELDNRPVRQGDRHIGLVALRLGARTVHAYWACHKATGGDEL